ncbi:hypothetical protein GCM10009535_58970 [Streptomyces thermocarboxydovorans]|uniref:Uncharacterized protein n=1 Tax=Streptomyces thermocarboxydovorans TaxID=59298 RepID=A0ABN1HX22_9ACTN
MPIQTGLTDAILIKLFHMGLSDKEMAEQYGISVQAVSKRRVLLGLRRKPVVREVNAYLAHRWKIKNTQGPNSHHKKHSAKALRVWLRRQLGDKTLKPDQLKMAEQWERGLRHRNVVLCYDPDTEAGWYYRPRTKEDGRLVIDWPQDLEFPDERFRKALELPDEPTNE